MANKFPLILNTSANQIQEIASGDNLDLTGCKIVGLDGINSGGIVTFTKAHVGAATTWGEDLVVTGNARVTGILTVGTNSVTISGNDVNITGVTTAANFKTGTSNLHNVGIELAGINVLGADTPIGTGATIYNSGAAVFTGIVTATNYVGTINTPAQPNITSVGTLSALNVSGNVSIGGTLTYEDVTNIDAVGLITARNGINVSGGTATFAAAIDANSDLDVDGHTNLDNVSIAGVSTFSGNATFETANTKNILFNKSDNRLDFGDNVKLALGDSQDLEIYHSSSDNFITADTQNLILKTTAANKGTYIQSDDHVWITTPAAGEVMAKFIKDGAVELNFNDTKRIETTNTGAVVTGICTATRVEAGSALFNDNGASSPIVSVRTDDASPWAFLIANDSYNTGSNGLHFNVDNAGTANIRNIGASSYNHIKIGVVNGGTHHQTLDIDETGISVLGAVTAKSALFTDDGSAGPLVNIQADDGSPWQLAITNASYSTGSHGIHFHTANAGTGHIRMLSKDTNFNTLKFGIQNSSGTNHNIFDIDNVGMRLKSTYDFLFDGQSASWTGNDRCKLQYHSNTLYICGGDSGGIRLRTYDGAKDGLIMDGSGNVTTSGTFTANGGGADAIKINVNGDLHFDGSGSWTGNDRTKIQHHSNTLYLCGGTSGIRFRNRSGGDEVYLNNSCEWQNFKISTDIRFPNATSTWTGEYAGKIQHHGSCLYIQGGAGTQGHIFRSGVHNSDSWYIHSSNSNDRAIEPAAGNAYNIGTSTKRVKRVYATTGDFDVPFGGSTSLTVNIGSAISSGTWTTAIGTGVLNHNHMYAVKIFWHYNGNGGTPFYALAGTFLCPASSNHANGTGRKENLVTSCHVGGDYYLAVRCKMHNSTNSGLEVANYGWTAQAGSYYSVVYKRVM